MAELERSTIGNQISFAEFLYKKPSLSSSGVDKVILRYQNKLHEADKDKFFQTAEEIMITNIKNEQLHDMVAKPKQPDPYKTNLYIEFSRGQNYKNVLLQSILQKNYNYIRKNPLHSNTK